MATNRKRTLKPRDYLESEEGTIIKKGRGSPSIALVYPNTYYLGMSNLGFQSVYAMFNSDPATVCERAVLPDDAALGSQATKPLRTIESGRAVADFDCVAFSISFENDYLYFLTILDLAGIAFNPAERDENTPIVLAGGAAITINPEPIRPFCDLLFVGEAEEAISEIAAVLRREDLSRGDKIAALAEIEGVYDARRDPPTDGVALAGSICPSHATPNSLEERVPLSLLRYYKRRVPADINGVPIETVIHTPYSEFGKLSLIEVQRGCGRGCKFCAEGFIYTPFRERSFDLLKDQVLRGLERRNKIGLIGADLLVYPQIVELMRFIHANGGTFSPSSVRLDSFTDDIIEELKISGHKSIAVAPEAGAEELRRKLNKKFNNAAVIESIERLVRGGIPNIKLYIMVGLPGETFADMEETAELIVDIRKMMVSVGRTLGHVGQLVVSVNPFIPKPRTPYQVGVFEGEEGLEFKLSYLKKRLLPLGGVKFYHENPFFAYVQALLSNGTTHVGDYLLEVFRSGGSLRKSLKPFLLSRSSSDKE